MVDLVCERPVGRLEDVDAYVPHLGGAAANVAVVAARAGASAAMCGGVGDDRWGAWLRGRLGAEGVDTTWLAGVPGCASQIALIAVDDGAEPSFMTYGDGGRAVEHGMGMHLAEALPATDALYLSSHCLGTRQGRALMGEAYASLRARGVPIVFDVNLRPWRWPSVEDAVRAIGGFLDGVTLLKVTGEEATRLTGEADPERAAEALVAAGVATVAVTVGSAGVLLHGQVSERMDAPRVAALSTVGAGDNLTGVLLARVAEDRLAAALPAAFAEGVEAAAHSTGHWGALD